MVKSTLVIVHVYIITIMIGSTVEVFTDADGQFTGLFFQDKLMKATYASYPEVIFVDATYKLNNLRMPMYILLVVDGNGQSEIIAIYITSLETEEAITKMVQVFKANNSCWDMTRVVMTDKDLIERAVFRNEFPKSSLLICLFHTLRSFKREITCEKLSIRAGEREHALELITAIAYSKSELKYNENYQLLLQSGMQSVISYYNNNWHPIRYEWVECYKGVNFTLGERTNNRLESINGKIKSVCSRHVNLDTFFDQFFAVLACLRNERDHSTLMAIVKKRVILSPINSPEWQYASLLTPYAFTYVQEQLSRMAKVSLAEDSTTGAHSVSTSEGNLSVTANSCCCRFWKTMHLPCRHILATRSKTQLPLYSPNLVSDRWKIKYIQEAFNSKKAMETTTSSFQVSM